MRIILSLLSILFFVFQACNSDMPNEFNREDYKIEVEEMPFPVGGIKALQEKVIYPEYAKDEEIEGTVLIKTFIDEKGDVIWTEVFKGTNPDLDTAALNAVKKVKFISGKHKGKKVKVQIVVPVSFKLE